MRRNLASLGTVNTGICVLAGCALIAAATFATADSQPRRQARSTHVGVSPSDLVMLQWVGPMSSQKFVRVNPDGSVDTSEFAIPAGMRLIVTDVDWGGTASPSVGSSFLTLRVWAENKTTSTTRAVVFLRHHLSTDLGSGGIGGQSTGTLTGFNVGAKARLVADWISTQQPTTAFGANTNVSPSLILRGYLVVDE